MGAILRNAVPNERAVIALCGISKLFVGELVEIGAPCGDCRVAGWACGRLLALSLVCAGVWRPCWPPRMLSHAATMCRRRMGCTRFQAPCRCDIRRPALSTECRAARVCASQEGHMGPLLPRHVHRAYQQLGAQGKVPNRPQVKRLLR
jgi:hypothetical protein